MARSKNSSSGVTRYSARCSREGSASGTLCGLAATRPGLGALPGAGIQARLERGHQIDDLARGFWRRFLDDVLPCLLGVDAPAQVFLVRVVVPVRLPRGSEALDQLRSHSQRLRVGLRWTRWQRVDVAPWYDLVGEAHGRHGQNVLEWSDRRQILLVPHDNRTDAD